MALLPAIVPLKNQTASPTTSTYKKPSYR